MFHSILALSMIGVTTGADARAQFQDGWWPVKFLFLIVGAVVSFLIPNVTFEVYGMCTRLWAWLPMLWLAC